MHKLLNILTILNIISPPKAEQLTDITHQLCASLAREAELLQANHALSLQLESIQTTRPTAQSKAYENPQKQLPAIQTELQTAQQAVTPSAEYIELRSKLRETQDELRELMAVNAEQAERIERLTASNLRDRIRIECLCKSDQCCLKNSGWGHTMFWYLGFDSTPTTLQSDTGDPLQPVYFGCPFPLTHPLKSAQPAYYKQNPKKADQHAMAAAAGAYAHHTYSEAEVIETRRLLDAAQKLSERINAVKRREKAAHTQKLSEHIEDKKQREKAARAQKLGEYIEAKKQREAAEADTATPNQARQIAKKKAKELKLLKQLQLMTQPQAHGRTKEKQQQK